MKEFLKSNKFRFGIIALVVVGIVIFLVTRPKSINQITFETEKAAKQTITLDVSAPGVVIPQTRHNVMVSSQYKVTEVNVKIGDKVTAGQQLGKLDEYALQNNVKKAQYNYNSAIYSRDQAKNAPIYDDLKVKQLQQQVNSAAIELQNAQRAAQNDQYIRSPIDGEVSEVNLIVGNTPSGTAAFIVQDTKVLKVRLTVNQADITKIEVGQGVKLKFSATQVEQTGKVSLIYPSAVTGSTGVVNYYVEVSIDDSKGLKADMSLDAEVHIASRENVIVVPSASISKRNSKSYVTIVTAQAPTPGGTLQTEEVEVTVGINNNTYAEILSGVNEGDEVVVSTNTGSSSSTGGFIPQRPASTN